MGHPMSEPWVDWRPIATAPKDGSWVLLFDGTNVFMGRWSEEAQFGRDDPYRPGWQIFECDDVWYSVADDTATHWAPKPRGPQS